MKEIWKEYKPDYFGSNLGRVKSFKRGNEKILKPRPDKDGYLKVTLYIDGERKHFFVHRLVAMAFIPNPENKPQVNHIDGNKQNNFVGNLEWATNSENMRHAFDTGLQKGIRGEDRSDSKLTNEEVEYIRNNPEGLTGRQLAKKFGVCTERITMIQTGRAYRDAGGQIRQAQKQRKKIRLTDEQKELARWLYVKRSKEFGSVALARMLGCDHSTILDIVNGK